MADAITKSEPESPKKRRRQRRLFTSKEWTVASCRLRKDERDAFVALAASRGFHSMSAMLAEIARKELGQHVNLCPIATMTPQSIVDAIPDIYLVSLVAKRLSSQKIIDVLMERADRGQLDRDPMKVDPAALAEARDAQKQLKALNKHIASVPIMKELNS